tara:strand:+ start:6019 stop:6372 length:354 start_codon:yes stop_codon:yes gene_type:complete
LNFPYEAVSPSNAKKRVFKGINDVYDEIMRIYEATEEKGLSIGQSLYSSCAFFVDYSLLLDSKIQDRIKEFNYCKTFSCSPYPSMMETPANVIDDFMIIEQEVNQCIQSKQKEANNA